MSAYVCVVYKNFLCMCLYQGVFGKGNYLPTHEMYLLEQMLSLAIVVGCIFIHVSILQKFMIFIIIYL